MSNHTNGTHQQSDLHDKKSNALDVFYDITTQRSNKRISVFLDYDGTLTPIVSNPDQAIISNEMRTTVSNLSQHHDTSIITGRRIDTINKFLQLPELYYGASHGFDVYGPHLKPLHAPAENYLPLLKQFNDTVHDKTKHIQGSLVEDCKYSISVHYRNVTNDNDNKFIADTVDSVLNVINNSNNNNLKLKKHSGKCVWEIKPDMKWNKGYAVDYLIDLLYNDNKQNIIPVYIGDDVTDEDAFDVVNRYNNGLSVFVVNTTQSRPTKAKYTVKDQQQVQQLLENITKLGKTKQ